MATGVGFSFDTSFLQNLEKADKKMEALMDKSNTLASSVTSAFQKMSSSGVIPFVNELENKLQALNSVKMSIGDDAKGQLKTLKDSASSAIDEINKLLSTLYKSQGYKSEVGLALDQTLDKEQYELWLKRKHSEAKEHKRIEDEKTQATIEAINKQNAAYAEQKRLSDTDEKRYNDWLRQKEREVQDHEDAERRKHNATMNVIARQNAAYAEQAKMVEKKRQEYAKLYAGLSPNDINYLLSSSRGVNPQIEFEQKQIKALTQAKFDLDKQDKNYVQTINNLDDAIARHKRNLQAITDALREQPREYEKNAQANRQSQRQKNTSYEGALDFSSRAKSINREKLAIQYLTEARNNLSKADADYQNKLNTLNSRIKQHNKNIQEATAGAKDLQEKHRGLMDTSGQLARAMAAVFSVSAIKGYVNKLMQIRGEFELQQRSLQVLLQNKDEANALWDKTVSLAVKSPYTTKQLVTATKQLAAYRVESEKLYETNKMLADVSIGLGVDMNRLILAFGQVKAANFLRGTELRQFSEAGVNMLDELAKRFTALEGRAVSIGEVFERVSKRMVSFADVEAVFKTITSEGGVFYQMQEKQSETLKGMMLNLKDSYELMLNDIGKSNEGMLKGFVSMMKTLVDNWQILSTVLKGIGAALVLYKLSVASTNRGLIAMALQMGVVNKTGTKQLTILNLLTLGFKKLTNGVTGAGSAMKAFIASNAITLTITAIVYALYKLYNAFSEHQEQLEEITNKYKELRREVTDISVKFTYASNIEEQKAELSKLIGVAKDKYNLSVDIDVKGLDEQEVSEKFNNLRNEILNTRAFTEQMSKAIVNSDTWFGNMFTDGIKTDFKEFSESAQELSTTLRNEVNMLIEYLEKSGQLTDELKEAFKPRTKDESELEYIERISRAYKEFYKANTSNSEFFKHGVSYLVDLWGKDLYSSIRKSYTAIVDFDNTQKEATKEFNEFADSVENRINSIPEEGRTFAVKAAIDEQGFDDFTREMWYRLANERFSVNITPKLPEKKEVTGWVKEYNKFVGTLQQAVDKEGNTLTIVKPMQADEDPTEYLNKLKGTYERLQKDIEAWDAGNAKARAQYTEDEINAIKAQNVERKKAIDWLEYDKKKNKKEESEELKRLKEQIRLVRQLADDYEEMWKKYGKAYADANIKSDARTNAFAELELDIEDFAVGSRQDEKNNLGKLLEKALGIEGGKVEVEKAIADVEVEVRWSLQEQANADLSRDIENLFGNYEMSLELEKLNIPKDLANQLFRVEAIDLTTLRTRLLDRVGLGYMSGKTNAEILDSAAYKKLNEHQQKELAAHLQKVSQMEQDEQETRLKKYIAFSRKAMSERAKIKFEELQTIAEIEKTFAIKEGDSEEVKAVKLSERVRALAQARKDASDAVQKLDWEAFKSSDTFNNIFDDLEHASDEVLKNVIQQLKDFKNQWKDMPFEQMRQVVDLLNKAEGALEESSNPFVEGTRLNNAIRKDGRTSQQAQLDLVTYEKAILLNDKDIARYELFSEIQSGITDSTFLSAEEQKNYAEWINLSAEEQALLNGDKKRERQWNILNAQSAKEQLTNYEKQRKSYEAQATAIGQMNQMTQDLYASFKGLHEALGGDSDSPEAIFAEMGMSVANSVASMIQLQLELQAASVSATAFGAAMNTALGVIGWINTGISVLTSVITAFTKAHDNKREKQIQKELKLVERLGKLYEKLEKQIEAAYSIDTFQAANDAAKENLEQQIRATERMIEAEKDKKDTDHKRIEEWKEHIEENLEMLEELEAKRLQELGGVGGEDYYKDAAEGFVDAWLEAFYETGDGLTALEDEFDEVMKNLVKKQVLQRVAGALLQPLLTSIDTAVGNDGVFDEKEFAATMELAKQIFPDFNEKMKQTIEEMGMTDWAGKNAELGSLAAGIQGVSEETANVISSYLNSIRFYVADSNTQLKALVAAQGGGTSGMQKANASGSVWSGEDNTPNPMLSQLLTIAEQTRAIRDMFESVIGRGGNNKHGGAYLKVDIG